MRTLWKKIGGMHYERTALSKKPDVLIKQELRPCVKRIATLLTSSSVISTCWIPGLKDTYGEKDDVTAILRELENSCCNCRYGNKNQNFSLKPSLPIANKKKTGQQLPGHFY